MKPSRNVINISVLALLKLLYFLVFTLLLDLKQLIQIQLFKFLSSFQQDKLAQIPSLITMQANLMLSYRNLARVMKDNLLCCFSTMHLSTFQYKLFRNLRWEKNSFSLITRKTSKTSSFLLNIYLGWDTSSQDNKKQNLQ